MQRPDDPYPTYDVLAKRDSPSWNDKTRQVIDQRMSLPEQPRFLSAIEWACLDALADIVVPQPAGRAPINTAAMIDARLLADRRDGYRSPTMPSMRKAWRQGLAALDAEARTRHGESFAALDEDLRQSLVKAMHGGELRHPSWEPMGCKPFFLSRVLPDLVSAYYAHPSAWSAIGFGGPASPRGYVRLQIDRHDPWEAIESNPMD